MMLIADGGSTTANWWMVESGTVSVRFQTEGYNPHFVDQAYITASLSRSLPENMKADQITEVAFYGSGCMAGKAVVMESALREVFPAAAVTAEVDLLAAARALLGKEAGFAAILGTGTNTCLYDGSRIIQNIDSLGYMLGDEGSGSYIGKKLLQHYLRELMPKDVEDAFRDWIGLSFDEIFDRVYGQPLPNRFCADLTRFAGDHLDHEYVRALVKDSFEDLFAALVSRYPGYRNYSFNCLGSVSYYFSPILSEVAGAYGMPMGRIIRSSMEELVRYHLKYPLKR